MNDMLAKMKPKDIVAVVCIVGYFALAIARPTVMVPSAIMLILGYYFAKRGDGKDNGN
jgi:hypothetical protein